MRPQEISPAMLEIATQVERRYLEAYLRLRSAREVAKEFNVTHQTVTRAIHRTEDRLTQRPPKSINHIIPSKRILVIPDIQARPGIDMSYLHAIGEYWAAKRPDIVICLGDFADMPSLSSYDKGKRSYEGARYKNDIEAATTAMKILLAPVNVYNEMQAKCHLPLYEPKKIMLLGNHEDRIDRATQLDPMLYGTIGIDDLKYKEFGWIVHAFKKTIVVDGIAFSHYFTTGKMGNPCGTAQQQLNKMHMSCISGHQQGRQTATGKRADGKLMTSIIAGSAYDYYMDYLGEQDNCHWRGVIMLHNIQDGEFDEVYVPTSYLKMRYPAPEGASMVFAPEVK